MKILAMTAAFVLSALLLSPLAAKENYKEQGTKADTKESYDKLAATVREEMKPGGQYQYIKPDEVKKVDKALDDMTALFDKAGSVASMTQDQKVALYNSQEIVNSILTLRDNDRVICKNEAPLGSHIPVTKCHTYAQEVQAREGTKNQMQQWNLTPCVGSGCNDPSQPVPGSKAGR